MNCSYIIGKMYEARKKTQGGNRGNQYSKVANTQIANLPKERKPRTDEILAAEIGVNHSTVVRAEKFSKGVDAIRDVSPRRCRCADALIRGFFLPPNTRFCSTKGASYT